MSPLALSLVLIAAVAHATWNLAAKQSAAGVTFVWLCAAVGTIAFAPAAAVELWVNGHSLSGQLALFVAGSGVLHAAYFVLVQLAYRQGDLSLVYPLARGTAPIFSTAAAVAVLGERPRPLTLAGSALVVGSVLALVRPGRAAGHYRGVKAAFTTATVIGAYTVWDKHAVSALHAPPIVYFWAVTCCYAAVLTPLVAGRGALRPSWTKHRREALIVGVLSPLAYILVLGALAISPVSYVAPAREISVVIGAFLGARVLGEQDARRRLASACGIVVGILLLALS